jgi:hypothetical protein
VTGAAVGWIVVSVGMAAMRMDPSPVLIAGIVGVVVAALWLLLDVSDVAPPISWGAGYGPDRLRKGGDVRVRTLHGQLLHGRQLDDGRALHGVLVDLVDDRLLAEHGIDRTSEPQRAAAALGPLLTDFVTNPPSAKRLGDVAFLASIVEQIESL